MQKVVPLYLAATIYNHWLNDDISFLPTLLNINMLDMWARAVVMIRDVNRVCVSYGSTM